MNYEERVNQLIEEIKRLTAHPALQHLCRERLPATPAQRAAAEELEEEVDARLALEELVNPAPTEEEVQRRLVENLEHAKETLRKMIELYGVK